MGLSTEQKVDSKSRPHDPPMILDGTVKTHPSVH